MSNDEIVFGSYNDIFLEKSWAWLNDSEIKEMTNTPDFTKDEQSIWYKSLKKRTDYKIWGVSYGLLPIAVMGLKHIDYTNKRAEYFGYIGDKQYWGQGIGKRMLEHAISQGQMLELRNIYLHVLSNNTRAVVLYQKAGFRIISDEGVNDNVSEKLFLMQKDI